MASYITNLFNSGRGTAGSILLKTRIPGPYKRSRINNTAGKYYRGIVFLW